MEAHLEAHHALAPAGHRLLELPLERVGPLDREVRRGLGERAHRLATEASPEQMRDEGGGHRSAAGSARGRPRLQPVGDGREHGGRAALDEQIGQAVAVDIGP